MKTITMLAIFLVMSGCAYCQANSNGRNQSLDSLLKRKHLCGLSGEMISMENLNGVTDAAFAYSYYYPKNFDEVVDTNSTSMYDTTKYISADKKCTLKLWPGKTIRFPLGTIGKDGNLVKLQSSDIIRVENIMKHYIKSVKAGKIKELTRIKIIEYCEGVNGYEFQFSLRGVKGNYGYIYKVDVSELPVSGDLIFKHFLYKYQLDSRVEYEAIGIAMANNFGTLRR